MFKCLYGILIISRIDFTSQFVFRLYCFCNAPTKSLNIIDFFFFSNFMVPKFPLKKKLVNKPKFWGKKFSSEKTFWVLIISELAILFDHHPQRCVTWRRGRMLQRRKENVECKKCTRYEKETRAVKVKSLRTAVWLLQRQISLHTANAILISSRC